MQNNEEHNGCTTKKNITGSYTKGEPYFKVFKAWWCASHDKYLKKEKDIRHKYKRDIKAILWVIKEHEGYVI